MFERILIPTDGSPGVERAIEAGLTLAKRYSAAIHVLYVVDTEALPLDKHARAIFDHLEVQGEKSVAAVVDRADDLGIESVTGRVLEGSPHESILDYIDRHDIDLVVMGTHGRRGLDRYLLGSVAERVVRLSEVPVLTVRMFDEEPESVTHD